MTTTESTAENVTTNVPIQVDSSCDITTLEHNNTVLANPEAATRTDEDSICRILEAFNTDDNIFGGSCKTSGREYSGCNGHSEVVQNKRVDYFQKPRCDQLTSKFFGVYIHKPFVKACKGQVLSRNGSVCTFKHTDVLQLNYQERSES